MELIDSKAAEKVAKIIGILEKNDFVRLDGIEDHWFNSNKKYLAIVEEKTLTLTERINGNGYIVIEEGISPSNLNKILKKYEVKECLIQKSD